MIHISCGGSYRQVSHLVKVLSQFSPLSNVVHLELKTQPYNSEGHFKDSFDRFDWQDLLQQFSTVKTLYVHWKLSGHVALALGDISAEALPSLDLICLATVEQRASSIERFLAARQLSGRPVTFVDFGWDFEERLKSYDSE
jgi:hypothetical protein